MFDFLKRKKNENEEVLRQPEVTTAAGPALPDWEIMRLVGPGYPSERILKEQEEKKEKGFYIPLSEMGEQDSQPETPEIDLSQFAATTDLSGEVRRKLEDVPIIGPGIPADDISWEQQSSHKQGSWAGEWEEPKTRMPNRNRQEDDFLRVDHVSRPPEQVPGIHYDEVETDFFQEAPTISPGNLARGLITPEEFHNRAYDWEKRKK